MDKKVVTIDPSPKGLLPKSRNQYNYSRQWPEKKIFGKKNILIIGLCCFFSNIGAQNLSPENQANSDSLLKSLEIEKIDSSRVRTLLFLAGVHYTTNPDTAIIICESAEKLAEKIDFDFGKSESYGWLGYLFTSKGAIQKAQEYNFKSWVLIEKSDDKVDDLPF